MKSGSHFFQSSRNGSAGGSISVMGPEGRRRFRPAARPVGRGSGEAVEQSPLCSSRLSSRREIPPPEAPVKRSGARGRADCALRPPAAPARPPAPGGGTPPLAQTRNCDPPPWRRRRPPVPVASRRATFAFFASAKMASGSKWEWPRRSRSRILERSIFSG